ncbi:MAG: hypothetical protein A2017_20210 [Lentisphaerae bacterium GWF2_44_16]|nr:MAG: hypothetical protein A2017_20210 [Lentisphaerae bacterium GWF2_44_16]
MKGPGYLENRTYDKGGRLVSKTLNGKLLCAYEYDNMNRRIKVDINGIKWEYKYDEFGQLVSAKSSDGKAMITVTIKSATALLSGEMLMHSTNSSSSQIRASNTMNTAI